MPVRPACYLPRPTSPFEAQGFRLRSRRAAMTAVELACLAVFVGAILLWALIGGGLERPH